MTRVRIAACQLNPVVGDIDGNTNKVLAALDQAEMAGADVAVFPELSLTGYPPEDLLLKSRFVADNEAALAKVAAQTGNCVAVVGFVDSERNLHNAAAICANGNVQGVYRKRLLPNYSVFDEQRYFSPGLETPNLYLIGGARVGVTICEDAWTSGGPIAEQAAGGAELIANLNASPFFAGRLEQRRRMLSTRAMDAGCALIYVNQVGGQDELVFDGGSLVINEEGELIASAEQFGETILICDIDLRHPFLKRFVDPSGRPAAPLPVVTISSYSQSNQTPREPLISTPLDPLAEIYAALVLGTRDYLAKNGFQDAVIGLSGGIDSSLVAAIAIDALGSDHVHGVLMPSRYSSEGSINDAQQLCARLGIEHQVIPIEPAHAALLSMVDESLVDQDAEIAHENLQSRIRGVVLMALSNASGWLVLTTANKSELAVGYSTLYGDTAGGFAVIKDVPKTVVYRLCNWLNDRERKDIIPSAVLAKPPSAELRPDQRDDQTLPPYELLDPVLEAYVEQDRTAAELEEAGFDAALVRRVVRLVDLAEYKRRQSPPGVRVTPKAFGKDRRMPITNGYSTSGA